MRAAWTPLGIALALAGLAAPAQAAGPVATRSALEREMRAAGPSSSALVVDLDSGETVYSLRADSPRVPASVNKLHTTATALMRLGPDATLTTDVLLARAPVDGVVDGDLYLRGGGDFTFGAAQSRRLATALADSGVTAIRGRVIGDEALFDARRGPPSEGFATSPGPDDRHARQLPGEPGGSHVDRPLTPTVVSGQLAGNGSEPGAAAASAISSPSASAV